jgi:hypothetical protein
MNHERPSMITPALVGAIFIGITSALPVLELVNCACCALVICGGVIALHLYQRDYPAHLSPISYGDAAVLGILTGVLGGFIWTIVDIPLEFLKLQLGLGLGDLSELEEVLRDADIPPEAREFMNAFFARGGLTLAVAFFSLLINVLVSAIFATLGSILGLALMGKKPGPPVYNQGYPQQPAP